MTETKEQILERMTDLMPWRLADQIKPYILEAMQIHADQQLILHSVVVPKGTLCETCQDKGQYYAGTLIGYVNCPDCND